MPIQECRAFPYGVYRRIWDYVPIPYGWLFPGGADLSVFFNYIVPPHIEGHVITTIHDLTYLRYPETMDKKNLRRIQKGIDYSIRRSSHILTVSEFSKRELIELLNLSEDKISVVYNAASLPLRCADFAECRRKWGLSGPYLLYVGTIEPRKNLTRLLKAFDLLKSREKLPHRLVLAGGCGWKDEEIFRTAKALRHASDVVFTGYVSAREKSALYQNAATFVFPSLYEGFGIPPLEAMSSGCPVVCSNAASLPEVVGEAARQVNPQDEEDIARGIWNVLADSGYASRLVEAGYRQAKKFTWEASAKRLAQVCRKVLEDP